MQNNDNTKSYKHTLNLPRTTFEIRAHAAVQDPQLIERWHKEELYRKSFDCNKGSQKFLFSDGPPYANGEIHLGSAYNKILKDIVTKSRRMMGFHVPCTPGWDCHGLPIELKVTKEYTGTDRLELKKACRAYADYWVEQQMKDFKRLAILMDWDRPYKTMDFSYEASVIRAFGQLTELGYIERKNKTVPWCASCQTVLATAEIEYAERKDPSLYVLFALDEASKKKLNASLDNKDVYFVIWTTTPWTLPLNQAVLLHPTASYSVVSIGNGRYGILASDLVDHFVPRLSLEKEVIATFQATDVEDKQLAAHHPFIQGKSVPIIKDESVLLSDGTACVHSAPGAGPEDYTIGIKHGLAIYSPLHPDGTMTNEIVPQELEGKKIEEVQSWVLQKLTENGMLLFKESIKHSYPHCWRCRKGLIFRATKQWFCSLTHKQLKEESIKAIDDMIMIPEGSHNRLKATIEARYEWCLSRQRVWGTPIPALLCKRCEYVHCTKQFTETVALLVEEQGIELWETVDLKGLIDNTFCCPRCGSTEWEKEKDILDVWFDAGLSHTAVHAHNPELGFPLDMYLEGKDQHRGYFQSALLTSVALHGISCMKTIVTHGFVVDGTGRKMSKSLGNGMTPQELIEKIGADCVRLWASSIDLGGEAVVSEVLINNITEVYRKLRNTCRFLLSNLYDFEYATDRIAFEKLPVIDQYALYELYKMNEAALKAYEVFNFTALAHIFADYSTTALSAFYLDVVKDRLYVEQANGQVRRSAQTVCYLILDVVAHLMAPICSFLAEYVTDHYQKNKKESVHLQPFVDATFIAPFIHTTIKKIWNNTSEQEMFSSYEALWNELKAMRSLILKAIEEVRQKGDIKHSLETQLMLVFDEQKNYYKQFAVLRALCAQAGQSVEQFIAEFCIVSQVQITVVHGDIVHPDGLEVTVQRAQGKKCPRCWQWQYTEHPDQLCTRCELVVKDF